jgi:single-strand DNA-binding protein
MAADNTTTITGNLTRAPETKAAGARNVTNLGLAVNRRYQVNGEWQEQVNFFNVVAWGELGDNAAASLTKGNRVTVTGRLEQRSYENKEGVNVNVVEIVADDIGASLKWATAEIARTERDSNSSFNSRNTAGADRNASIAAEEPF